MLLRPFGPERLYGTNSSDGLSKIWRHAKKRLASHCSNAGIGTAKDCQILLAVICIGRGEPIVFPMHVNNK